MPDLFLRVEHGDDDLLIAALIVSAMHVSGMVALFRKTASCSIAGRIGRIAVRPGPPRRRLPRSLRLPRLTAQGPTRTFVPDRGASTLAFMP
jgi:hypothetical protein